MKLREVVEKEKEELIHKLINMNYFETPDGYQLYELTYTELKQIYKTLKEGERN